MDDEPNRRRLSDKEVEELKDQLLESIYKDIGKSFVKGFLWIFGTLSLALLAWLGGSGHLTK